MRLSCLPVSFFARMSEGELTIPGWAAMAKSIGFEYIDFSVMHIRSHTPVYLSGLADGIAAAGVSPMMLCAYPDFTHPSAEQRRRERSFLECDIAAAAQLGAPYLRVLAGQAHPETSRADGIAWATYGLRHAADSAEQLGVTLLYENHSKPGAWFYTDFSHQADIFLEIVHDIRGSGIGINFDTVNTLIAGDDTMSVLSEVADLVRTVHIADSSETDRLNPSVIGTGKAPIREVLAFLKARGFDGDLCIEEASGTGEAGVKAAREYVLGVWDSI